jgi:outer membrane immunogenic protein
MIRCIFLASVGAMALAGTALAADLAPPPPAPPPPPLWTGFYIGVNAGYDWAASKSINIVTAPLFTDALGVVPGLSAVANGNIPVQNSGFIGGGQIGYNYQFATSWVVGLEADIDGLAGAHGSGNASTVATVVGVPVTTDLFASKSLNYLGTVRGRFGYLLTPTLLIYGGGGLAYGGVNMHADVFQSGTPG